MCAEGDVDGSDVLVRGVGGGQEKRRRNRQEGREWGGEGLIVIGTNDGYEGGR